MLGISGRASKPRGPVDPTKSCGPYTLVCVINRPSSSKRTDLTDRGDAAFATKMYTGPVGSNDIPSSGAANRRSLSNDTQASSPLACSIDSGFFGCRIVIIPGPGRCPQSPSLGCRVLSSVWVARCENDVVMLTPRGSASQAQSNRAIISAVHRPTRVRNRDRIILSCSIQKACSSTVPALLPFRNGSPKIDSSSRNTNLVEKRKRENSRK